MLTVIELWLGMVGALSTFERYMPMKCLIRFMEISSYLISLHVPFSSSPLYEQLVLWSVYNFFLLTLMLRI